MSPKKSLWQHLSEDWIKTGMALAMVFIGAQDVLGDLGHTSPAAPVPQADAYRIAHQVVESELRPLKEDIDTKFSGVNQRIDDLRADLRSNAGMDDDATPHMAGR